MDQYVSIASCTETFEASMIQMELESSGIDSQLDNEFTVGVDPLLSNAVGGIKIKVAPEDAEASAEVLQKYYEHQAQERERKARVCPECKHKEGEAIRKPNWVGILSVLTLGAFSVFYAWPKFKCPRCKHRWA